ncbi:hypothetical protein IRZ83_05715 [Flavobacterium sp. JLP]|uniref:hypothetical protein n=1 Tax=unclassified Flavobacterium TaxID=196869 RepID=UPI00188CE708|nr:MULTISPECIES: hypothetical protein [unclassified Flavobacterium]MBF4492561.1 hypothetical protein [Flavobacterium sp. MR2016-29]MBF4506160.1 hypothetical protein [Flavobacterium sp. JLP]
MKKILLCLLLFYKSILFSQTILNSYPLDLKISGINNELLNVENVKTHEVFVFASDNENISILKYNASLFLTDQYKAPIKNLDDKHLIGYSFSEDGNPTLYWSRLDFSYIFAIKYYLESKTFKVLNFSFPSADQYVVDIFQKNNSFYILSKDVSKPTLNVYAFKNGTVEEKIFDFSPFTFQDKSTHLLTFTQLIKENPIEKIEAGDYNSLYKSAKKSKFYVLDDKFILTLDYNPKKTQVFEISMESEEIKEKNFTQSIIQNPKIVSNSFYHQNKLYQITADKSQMFLDIKDFNSNQTIKSFKVSKDENINFKISSFFLERDGAKPKEFEKTNVFLQHLSKLDIGLSVFKNDQNTFIMLGGASEIEKPSSMFNNFYDPFTQDFPEANFYQGGYPAEIHSKSVYFETELNDNHEFVNPEPQPLAIDNISYFLDINKKVTLQSIMKFKDYYILGYYDKGTKQYIMRKFQDGFETDDAIDPLDTPSSFSKSFSKNRR